MLPRQLGFGGQSSRNKKPTERTPKGLHYDSPVGLSLANPSAAHTDCETTEGLGEKSHREARTLKLYQGLHGVREIKVAV